MMPKLPPGWEWDGSCARAKALETGQALFLDCGSPEATAREAWARWHDYTGITAEQWLQFENGAELLAALQSGHVARIECFDGDGGRKVWEAEGPNGVTDFYAGPVAAARALV